jgi:hypothetical protein
VAARREPESVLTLVFCTGGQAQLEEDGEVIWHSDDDDDFRSTISEEFLSEDDDAERIFEFLVDKGILTEEEAEECEIEVESLNGDEVMDAD